MKKGENLMKKRRKLFYRHRLASSIFYLFSFTALICTVSIVYTAITSSLNISGEGKIDGPVNEYYYYSGYFYKDEACTKSSGISKFSEAVQKIASPGTIHMMSNYTVGVGTEEVTVGAKNIQVKRHPGFTGYSMFFIIVSSSSEYRTFTIKAENSSGSMVFDGQNIEVSTDEGGLFNLYGANATLNIIGSEKSNGEKNVKLINSKIKNSSYSVGGAIENYFGGTVDLTHCELSGNSAISSSNWAEGGAIYTTNNVATLNLNSCTIRNNITSGINDRVQGGGVYNGNSMTIKGKTIIEGNKSIINGVEKEDNLYLEFPYSKIDTSGLTSGSRIGITTSKTPTSSSSITISPSGSAAFTVSYFFSDISGYVVELVDNALVLKVE